MQYVKFGKSGMDVSRICLGMMSFGKPGKENGVFPWAKDYEDAKPIFKKAIDLGINYFDTANVYQLGTSEEITGRLIKEYGLEDIHFFLLCGFRGRRRESSASLKASRLLHVKQYNIWKSAREAYIASGL